MNIYTSDGLLVEQVPGADDAVLSSQHGQQLISLYRLFLHLHHAGNGDMRLKDMIKPDTVDTANENSADVATGDRRGTNSRGAALHHPWSSMPSMPEAASAYAGSAAAAISTGTPYPMFLLSSNAVAETHRLRGFPDLPAQSRTFAGELKNNNRSANGCDEIPLRWSLLAKQQLAAYAHDRVNGSVASTVPATEDGEANGVDGVVADGGAAALPTPRVFASGWVAAELQVHTTRRTFTCTATEMSLAGEPDVQRDDGDTPLVFCCSVIPGSS